MAAEEMTSEEKAALAAVTDRTWPATVKLASPIVIGDGKVCITELVFRKGVSGDLKGVSVGRDGLTIDQIITIASRMTGQPAMVIERIDQDDFGEVLEIVLGFFAKCLGAGKTR